MSIQQFQTIQIAGTSSLELALFNQSVFFLPSYYLVLGIIEKKSNDRGILYVCVLWFFKVKNNATRKMVEQRNWIFLSLLACNSRHECKI